MKKKKIILSVLTIMMLVLLMTVPVNAAAKISKTKSTLIKGQTLQLKVTGTKSKPKWSSSKKSVASVSSAGKVTAKKKGTATITAKIGKKKYTCKITVETPSLSKKTVSLNVGKSTTIKLNGTKQKITWKSSNSKVASVKNGKITGKSAGSATITATVLKKKYTCKVTVKKTSQSSNSTNPDTSAQVHPYAKQILNLVNAERAKAGVPALKLDTTVTAAANVRAKELEKSFSHTRPDGTPFITALLDKKASFLLAGENIGEETIGSPELMMSAWMSSTGHRANILNKNFTSLGVGYYEGKGGCKYWVQIFTY